MLSERHETGKESNMNKKLRRIAVFLAAVAVGAGLFSAGMAFGAGNGEPGSQGDPIVTLSYLESRLAGLGNGQNAYPGENSPEAGETDTCFRKISLTKGQSIDIAEGTMLIVYSGNGRICGGSGMLNLSTGEMFENGTSAVLYTIFMAVGDDSSLEALSSMTVYLMGSYDRIA